MLLASILNMHVKCIKKKPTTSKCCQGLYNPCKVIKRVPYWITVCFMCLFVYIFCINKVPICQWKHVSIKLIPYSNFAVVASISYHIIAALVFFSWNDYFIIKSKHCDYEINIVCLEQWEMSVFNIPFFILVEVYLDCVPIFSYKCRVMYMCV